MSDTILGGEWYVENNWECTTCKATNLGRHLNCQKCGARKTEDAKEWMPGDDKPVTDPEMLRQAKAGPNWVCEYCGGQERDLNGDCTQCGGPKAHEREPIPTAKIESYHGVSNRGPIRLPGRLDGVKRWIKNNPDKIFIGGGVTLAVSFLVGLLVWISTPRYVDVKVSKTTWTYTENLRQKVLKQAAGWGHTYTAGYHNEPTLNVHCDTRYYGTETCHPHNCNAHSVTYSCNCQSYSCNCSTSCTSGRNGYSRCSRSCGTCSRCSTCSRLEYDTCWDQCPVYKDWCSYGYYDWPIIQTQKTFGDDQNVHWPGIKYGSPDQEVEKKEEYTIYFSCPDDTYEYNPGTLWNYTRFHIGDYWTIQVGKIRTHNIEKIVKKK